MPYFHLLTSPYFASPHYPFANPWWARGPHNQNLRDHYSISSPAKSQFPSAHKTNDSTFASLASSVRHDLVNLGTWADELPKLRKQCDELYQEAKKAQSAGEYGRAARRLREVKGMLRRVDGEWRQAGMKGTARGAKGMLN